MSQKGAVSHGMLKVVCKIPVYSLQEFGFELKPNSHAYANIKVILEDTETTAYLLDDIHGESIRIVRMQEDGKDKYPPVFAGLIIKCEIRHEGGLRTADILAVSGSILLDTAIKSRSFQDTDMSYKDLVSKVIKDTQKAEFLYFADQQKLGKPVIQYEETDYTFLKRMASHQNCCIYPDIAEPVPRIIYGLRVGEDKGEAEHYSTGIAGFAENREKIAGGIDKNRLHYYEMKSKEDFRVGDSLQLCGRRYRVFTQKGVLEKGLLYYTYTLANERWDWQGKKYNEALRGASLSGTVMETKQESVRIHLDIDASQEQDKAYYFPWKPETGNMMYCMPEIGTKVYLSIGGLDEGDALAVSNIRRNGAYCPDTQNTDKRFLANEHLKVMKQHLERIEFEAENKEGKVSKLTR